MGAYYNEPVQTAYNGRPCTEPDPIAQSLYSVPAIMKNLLPLH